MAFSWTDANETARTERDPDVVNSEAALQRAAQRARELARRTVGYVVIYRDGKIVKDRVDD